MSQNILILNGSPRKNGNTAFLIGKLIEGIIEVAPEAQIETARLHTLKIGPCRACDGCRKDERIGKYCVYQDDMAELYHKVVRCDVLVLANPIYWFCFPAQTKLFLDRLYGLWLERTHLLKGKALAGLLVYGDEDPYISGAVNAIHMHQDIARYSGMAYKGVAYGTANNIGDAENDAALCEKAKNLGKALL